MTAYSPVTDMLDTPPASIDPADLAAMPPALVQRPWHPRLHVPVPVMNVHTDSRHAVPFVDFLGVDPQVAALCMRDRLCGVCGGEIGEELALLGTVQAAMLGMFSDPHMHEDCARQALRWCPHLRLRHHQRAPQHRRHPDTPELSEWDTTDRPDRWALLITDDVAMSTLEGMMMWRAAGYLRMSVFAYLGENDSLVEYATLSGHAAEAARLTS